MDVLFWMISIHLVIYIAMLVSAYIVRKKEQEEWGSHITIRRIFNYWLGVCYIPFFGPLCILTILTCWGLEELKDWFIKTKFWQKIQDILDKEIKI